MTILQTIRVKPLILANMDRGTLIRRTVMDYGATY